MTKSPGKNTPTNTLRQDGPPERREAASRDAPPSRNAASDRAPGPGRSTARQPVRRHEHPEAPPRRLGGAHRAAGLDDGEEDNAGHAEQTARAERLQDATYPRYGIGVVTDLTGIPAQQLRRYEEAGLLTPHRTAGGTRQYSDADVVRLLEIGQLNEEGVNLPGIQHILRLRAQLDAARAKRTPPREGGERNVRGRARQRRAASQRSQTPPTSQGDASDGDH